MATAKILAALIAAGAGTRFGGNKLEAMLGGEMLGAMAAAKMRDAKVGSGIAVTRRDMLRLNQWLLDHDFSVISNDDPAAGLSRSIALAAREAITRRADGLLICLADMPFVPVDHFQQLVAAFARRTPGEIVASTAGTAAMPPAIFPSTLFEALAALTGDSGARLLLAQATRISVDSRWLIDIDTQDDLVRATTELIRK